MHEVQSRMSHRGKGHRKNSSSGGLSKHQVASDLVIHGQDLCIFPTQGSQLRSGEMLGERGERRHNIVTLGSGFGAWCQRSDAGSCLRNCLHLPKIRWLYENFPKDSHLHGEQNNGV